MDSANGECGRTVTGMADEQKLPMMLEDTLNAFTCCVCTPPECEKCPLCDDSPDYGCKDTLKHSVKYWLMRARMLDDAD